MPLHPAGPRFLGDLSVSLPADDDSSEAESVHPIAKGVAETTGNPTQIENKDVGTLDRSREIYRSEKNDKGEYTWLDNCPEDVTESAENDETAKFAFVVRKQKSTDSRKKLEVHSLIIQSPWLRTALADILMDYPGVTCEMTRLVFEKPFAPLAHRWAKFQKYKERKHLDHKTRAHIDLLHDVLQEEIGAQMKELKEHVDNGVISFEMLWMIFPPGSIVVAGSQTVSHWNQFSGYAVISTDYVTTSDFLTRREETFLKVKTECIDCTGLHFGRSSDSIRVPKFSGLQDISSLPVSPLESLDRRKDETRAELVKHGERFEAMLGVSYRAYDGIAITWNKRNEEEPIYVTGRIVIDVDAFQRYTIYPCRNVRKLEDYDLNKLAESNKSSLILVADHDRAREKIQEDRATINEEKIKLKLPPQHHIICRSRVRGYSLKLKKWLEFFVSNISDIEWSINAFDSLVLPEDHKELILSFTESQARNQNAFDDVIADKGRGIIMLLAGPPGVGKTLTAEAVSEKMRCPLHSITPGDLGSDPQVLESALSRTLDLVTRWNAVLLIDECDVFLEARSPYDVERNMIVAIFLRTLEYYKGIMFMTTNRLDNIDIAFESRIHATLKYPDITNKSRRRIWHNIIKAMPNPNDLTEMDLNELATVKLNGRQVKNILKMAQLLALHQNVKLNKKLIESALVFGMGSIGVKLEKIYCEARTGEETKKPKCADSESEADNTEMAIQGQPKAKRRRRDEFPM